MALIDRIKYDSPSDDAIVWKYPSDQIRLGAQLIVNESQEAVFFKGGRALDTFGAGTHTLQSGNLPLLDKLINLPFGGATPFSAEIWYVNKTVKRDLKWGTPGPIQVIDPVYNFPISVRSFGSWGIRIEDARSFLVQLVGSQTSSANKGYIGSDRVEEYFGGTIIQRLSDALAKFFVERNISAFQASAHLNDLSTFLSNDLVADFQSFGIEIVNFNVARISIPEEEQRRFQDVLGKRLEIDQISQARVGPAYTTMRTFDTLEKAAGTDGGAVGQLLGAGLGLSAGMQVGRQLGAAMDVQPEGDGSGDIATRLGQLKQLLDAGLITQGDFDEKKKSLLDSL